MWIIQGNENSRQDKQDWQDTIQSCISCKSCQNIWLKLKQISIYFKSKGKKIATDIKEDFFSVLSVADKYKQWFIQIILPYFLKEIYKLPISISKCVYNFLTLKNQVRFEWQIWEHYFLTLRCYSVYYPYCCYCTVNIQG